MVTRSHEPPSMVIWATVNVMGSRATLRVDTGLYRNHVEAPKSLYMIHVLGQPIVLTVAHTGILRVLGKRNSKDRSILGSILGPPIYGNPPLEPMQGRLRQTDRDLKGRLWDYYIWAQTACSWRLIGNIG